MDEQVAPGKTQADKDETGKTEIRKRLNPIRYVRTQKGFYKSISDTRKTRKGLLTE